MSDLSTNSIPIFPGINDQPVAPTASKAGNGAHLISAHNGLITNLEATFQNAFPRQWTHWHDESVVTNGNNIVFYSNTGRFFNFLGQQEPPQLADSFKFFPILAAGNYNLTALGRAGADCGRLTLSIDNFIQNGNIDFYSTTDNFNARISMPVTINNSGIHLFEFQVDKNQASSNYFINVTKFWLMTVN